MLWKVNLMLGDGKSVFEKVLSIQVFIFTENTVNEACHELKRKYVCKRITKEIMTKSQDANSEFDIQDQT